MKMTDEHPDDFVTMAKRIEQARNAKDQELVRWCVFCSSFIITHTYKQHQNQKRAQVAQSMMMQETQQERELRQSQTEKVMEEERRRRLEDSGNARRLSTAFHQSLKLSEQVPMKF